MPVCIDMVSPASVLPSSVSNSSDVPCKSSEQEQEENSKPKLSQKYQRLSPCGRCSSIVRKISYTEHCHLIWNTYGIRNAKRDSRLKETKEILQCNFGEFTFNYITEQFNYQLNNGSQNENYTRAEQRPEVISLCHLFSHIFRTESVKYNYPERVTYHVKVNACML